MQKVAGLLISPYLLTWPKTSPTAHWSQDNLNRLLFQNYLRTFFLLFFYRFCCSWPGDYVSQIFLLPRLEKSERNSGQLSTPLSLALLFSLVRLLPSVMLTTYYNRRVCTLFVFCKPIIRNIQKRYPHPQSGVSEVIYTTSFNGAYTQHSSISVFNFCVRKCDLAP